MTNRGHLLPLAPAHLFQALIRGASRGENVSLWRFLLPHPLVKFEFPLNLVASRTTAVRPWIMPNAMMFTE